MKAWLGLPSSSLFIRHSFDGSDSVLQLRDPLHGAVWRHHIVLGQIHDDLALAGFEAFQKGVKLFHRLPLGPSDMLDNSTPAAKLTSMRATTILALLALGLLQTPASALEPGDIVTLTSNGVGLTVLSVKRPDPKTVEVVAQRMKANAASFCEEYKGLAPRSAEWTLCISEHVSTGVHKISVRCSTATILLTNDKGSSGSYRRPSDGGPWVSAADPNTIMHADDLFEAACLR